MQDNKAAYLAGKNMALGSSTPPSFTTASEQQSFQAAQDEKAYVEQAKGNQSDNVQNYQFQTESYQNAPSPKDVAEKTGKDPYNTLTDEEKENLPSFKEENNEIKSFVKKYLQMGGITGAAAQAMLLPFRMIAEPTVETFQNPQALAVLKLLFDEKGKKFKDKYLEDHGDIIGDAFKEERELLKEGGQGITTLDFFNQELDEAARMSEEGILGAGSQQINFPAEFYTGEKGLNPYGSGGIPQTSGDLVNLASLAVTPEMQGTNPELANMIFAARAELDRMGKNYLTGNPQGGGGQGGGGTYVPPANPANPANPTDPNPTLPITSPPNTTPRFPDSVIRDYTQLGLPQIYGNQQIPNYGNFYQGQGGQPIGLQNYLDTLKKRFGIG